MAHREPARTATRRTRSTVLALLLFLGAAVLGLAASTIDLLPGDAGSSSAALSGPPSTADRVPLDADSRPVLQSPGPMRGEEAGALPDGVSVFDDDFPAVANLDPDLLGALRAAAMDAAEEGVVFVVNSGWRSPEYQEQLLREAVSEYGSVSEAARWVATADTSLHVSGDAVDIGHSDATSWLSEHGDRYGLCPVYENEPWHYELRPDAIDDGCPPLYPDPTHDPRLQP